MRVFNRNDCLVTHAHRAGKRENERGVDFLSNYSQYISIHTYPNIAWRPSANYLWYIRTICLTHIYYGMFFDSIYMLVYMHIVCGLWYIHTFCVTQGCAQKVHIVQKFWESRLKLKCCLKNCVGCQLKYCTCFCILMHAHRHMNAHRRACIHACIWCKYA